MMAGGFSIRGEVDGLADVVATLSGLADKLQRKIVRKALSKATKPTLAAAKRNCPTDSGLLKKSLGRKVVTYTESGTLVAIIGPRKGFRRMVNHGGRMILEDPVNIAHLVEFGTKPHSIEKGARHRGKLKAFSDDLAARGIGKIHPGAKPKPFLQPAFDSTKAQVIAIFTEEVATGLAAELAKE